MCQQQTCFVFFGFICLFFCQPKQKKRNIHKKPPSIAIGAEMIKAKLLLTSLFVITTVVIVSTVVAQDVCLHGTDCIIIQEGTPGDAGQDGFLTSFTNTIRVEKAPHGNDTACSVNGPPCLTIGQALSLSSSGIQVMVFPGFYNESELTLPNGVAVRGSQKNLITIQSLFVTTNATILTMGENSHLQDVTVRLTSLQHHTLTGIAMPGTTSATATIADVDVVVDNSYTATDGGTSFVAGIHSYGTGQPDVGYEALQRVGVTVHSRGNGFARALLADTATHQLYVSSSVFVASMTGTSGTLGRVVGVETNDAGATVDVRYCTFSVTSSGGYSGTVADWRQTLGALTVGPVSNYPANTIGVEKLPWGNDAKCARGYVPCLTIARAFAIATAGDQVIIQPGTYLEFDLTILDGVSVRGAQSSNVIIGRTGATSSTTVITMGENSRLEDVTILLTATVNNAYKGIVFAGTTAATAMVRNVNITMDVASPATGASNMVGIHSTGSGVADESFEAVKGGRIVLSSVATTGSMRGVLVDTAAATFRVSSINVRLTVSNAAVTRVGVEVNQASAVLDVRYSYLSGSTSTSQPDWLQTAGSLKFTPPPFCNFGALCVTPAPVGDDLRCQKTYYHCATISRALALATPMTLILVGPGTYAEGTLTISTQVTLRGLDRTRSIISFTSLAAASNTIGVIMSTFSRLESMTITMTSSNHLTMTGLLFPGATVANACIRDVTISMDNSGASSTGTSTAIGILSTGTGSPLKNFEAVSRSDITVKSTGSGSSRGIRIQTAAHTLIVSHVSLLASMSAGNGTAYGLESAISGGILEFRAGVTSASHSGTGTAVDWVETAGSIAVDAPPCPGNAVCVMKQPWGDDTRCGIRTWPCLTIARAVAVGPLSSTPGLILVSPGTYLETSNFVSIQSSYVIKGASRDSVIIQRHFSSSGIFFQNVVLGLEDLTIQITALAPSITVTGISFFSQGQGTQMRRVRLTINGTSITGGPSTLTAVTFNAVGSAITLDAYDIEDSVIEVLGTGTGAKRAFATSLGVTFRARNSDFIVSGGTTTDYIAVETTTVSTMTLQFFQGSINGQGADISAVAESTIQLYGTKLVNSLFNSKPFTIKSGYTTETFSSIAAVISATDVWLSQGGSSTTIIQRRVDRQCVVHSLAVAWDGGTGSSSATVRLQLNGTDTSTQASVSTAATGSSSSSGITPTRFQQNDLLSVKWIRGSAVTQASRVTVTVFLY
jgi:hypothetical protein